MDGQPKRHLLAELGDVEREVALARSGILYPHLFQGIPLSQVAQAQGLVLRTLQRWLRAYRRDGLAGLVRTKRSDRGQYRIPVTLQYLVEGFALQKPAPSIAYIHRHVVEIARQEGWPIPSFITVYRIVRALTPALVILAHEGTKAYQESFDVLYRRKATQPNAIWQADHSPLEILLLNENEEPSQPWLTAIVDDFSRGISMTVLPERIKFLSWMRSSTNVPPILISAHRGLFFEAYITYRENTSLSRKIGSDKR